MLLGDSLLEETLWYELPSFEWANELREVEWAELTVAELYFPLFYYLKMWPSFQKINKFFIGHLATYFLNGGFSKFYW